MRELAQIEAHKHHLVGQEVSDADDEDEEEEDWNVDGRAYVTSDGDIMPSFHKKGKASKKKRSVEEANGAPGPAGL